VLDSEGDRVCVFSNGVFRTTASSSDLTTLVSHEDGRDGNQTSGASSSSQLSPASAVSKSSSSETSNEMITTAIVETSYYEKRDQVREKRSVSLVRRTSRSLPRDYWTRRFANLNPFLDCGCDDG
jgi:hypothetical protein